MNYNKAMVRASAHFLTDELPDDWYKMTDEEIKKFLYMNACLDYADMDDIFNAIDVLAMEFVEIWNDCKRAYDVFDD